MDIDSILTLSCAGSMTELMEAYCFGQCPVHRKCSVNLSNYDFYLATKDKDTSLYVVFYSFISMSVVDDKE